MVLHASPEGVDGLKHPPATFFIGPDRGYLLYSRQPPFCRSCWSAGHVEGVCPGRKCRLCTETGHEAKDCRAPKKCHVCGESGHLARSCPSSERTFARVVAGLAADGMPVDPEPEVEEGQMEQGGPAVVESAGSIALFNTEEEEQADGRGSAKTSRALSSPEERGDNKKTKRAEEEMESEDTSLEMDNYASTFVGGAPITPIQDWSEVLTFLDNAEPITGSEDSEPLEEEDRWRVQKARKKRRAKKSELSQDGKETARDPSPVKELEGTAQEGTLVAGL